MKLTNKSYPLARAVRTALFAGVTASLLAMPIAFAAEADDEESKIEEVTTEEVEGEVNKVIITGSRLQRETHTSLSPLQVITAEASRQAGLIDAASILQNAAQSTGQQIDLTFSGFVLDNGPGASTANLRGLGADRTLTLLNGRRLAPSGVEGAPSAPDLNLIPGALIQQYDLLLDGASSIYGSDAVAGVANVILREDFDGLELDIFTTVPEQSSGKSTTLSATWGKNYDRGFVGVGVEFTKTQHVTLQDRRWTADCERHVEIDTNGDINHVDVFDPSNGQRPDPNGCVRSSLAGRIIVPNALGGSLYYTPGESNGGWLNWSESNAPFTGNGINTSGDGFNDVNFQDYSLNATGIRAQGDLFPKTERLSVMAYGEYTFEGEANITPFFEASFNKRDVWVNSSQGQLFPFIQANNPYNPCNPNGINGVDCGLAWDALLEQPAVWRPIFDAFGCTVFAGGTCPQAGGPAGPLTTRVVVAVKGDRTNVRTTVEQTRLVFGVKGDMPWVDFGPVTDWQFETYISYTKSDGDGHRQGIRNDRIDQSADVVETSPGSGEYVCVDQSNGCVPVNWFAPSLYENIQGDFATRAERDFLFDSRDFITEYEQTIVSGFAGGSIFELPAGSVTAGFGFEYRLDDINSVPDDIARDGLFFGFFSDGGAVGDKDTKEYFFEIEAPIIANMPGIQELVVNISGRSTKDEFYGTNSTWSYKVGYRPIDSLLLRTTKGTSYRAPNVRENFLRAQSGFSGVFDPCAIPEDALSGLPEVYDPALDQRTAIVLQNCLNQGVDPTTQVNAGANVFSTEIAQGGFLGLDEERSESLTWGFSWAQPFTNDFDLTVGATYYKISIDDTIVAPSAGFIVFDCYNDPEFDSNFCDRITRDANGVFDVIDSSFLNRDNQTVRGVDVNINFAVDFPVLGTPVHWTADLVATHTKENSTLFTSDDGTINFDENAGEFGFPDWRGNLQFGAGLGNYRLTWTVNYIGSVHQDVDNVDDFDNAITGFSDTCVGDDGVLCRDFVEAKNYMTHALSFAYYGDQWTLIAGSRNIFNKAPPEVNGGGGVTSRNNTPLGYGYDLNGRTFFVNIKTQF